MYYWCKDSNQALHIPGLVFLDTREQNWLRKATQRASDVKMASLRRHFGTKCSRGRVFKFMIVSKKKDMPSCQHTTASVSLLF